MRLVCAPYQVSRRLVKIEALCHIRQCIQCTPRAGHGTLAAIALQEKKGLVRMSTVFPLPPLPPCPWWAQRALSRTPHFTAWAATTRNMPGRWVLPGASRRFLHETRRCGAAGRGRPDGPHALPSLTANRTMRSNWSWPLAGRARHCGGQCAGACLWLCRRPGYDTPRPAERHEKAGPPLVHWRGFDHSAPIGPITRPRRRATWPRPPSGCRSTAQTASAAPWRS